MPLILGTNSIKDTGYNVANSIMFDDGDSSIYKNQLLQEIEKHLHLALG